MKLDVLISEFRAAERALARAVKSGESAAESAALLRRSADLLDKIELFVPVTQQDRRDKAYFFLRRGLSGTPIPLRDRDIDIALALGSDPGPPSAEHTAGEALTGDPSGEGLIAYVRGSVERVSIIDGEFRYLATSAANARYYGTRPVRLVGTLVSDFIGVERFERRAKARLQACLSGEPQEYYHRAGPGSAPQILRVQMKPARIDGLGPVVLTYVQDVTDNISRGIEAEPFLPAIDEAGEMP